MEKTKKLKAIAILTIAIMIVQVILPLSSALAVKIGDANGDGRITITDLSLLKRYLVSGRDDYVQAMDINSDSRITITDLSRLKLILVGELEEPGDVETGEIEITVDTTSWTNENVKATITYPNLGSGYKKQYSLDGSTWQDYTRTVEVEKNGVIYARLLNSSDQVVASTNVTISNIDKLAPQSFEAQIKQSVTNVIRVIGETEDTEARDGNGKSGVARYYFSKNSGTNWETNQDMSENQYIYKDLESSTEYGMMVRAIDGAGNTTETPIRRVKTYKNIIDILIDRGVITEDQVDRETGIITMEDGSQYEIEIKEDGGYEIVYVGPDNLEDLTEEEREYQQIQEEKLEEETEKAIIDEIIDRLIEEGVITEEQVDRETGRIEKDGKVYEIKINEDGTYELVEIGEIETAGPTIGYTIEPKEATKIATIEIIVKGENITKIVLPTGEEKTYNNEEEVREEIQVSENGKYTVKATGNGKEVEGTIIVANIIETPAINIIKTTEQATNLEEEMKVIIEYGKTILENGNKYEYEVETEKGSTGWIAAEGKRVEIIVEENMKVRARYNDGTSGLGQKEIVVDNVDTIAPDAYNIKVVSTDSIIRVSGETEDTANEGAREGIAGVARYEYKIEGGEWQARGEFSGLEANTGYKVYARAIDNAGNIREASNNGIVVKTKEEGDNSLITVSMNTDEWTNKDVEIYLSIEGTEKLQYKEKEETNWKDYEEKITVSSNKTIEARIENGEEIEIVVDYIDKLYPQAFTPSLIYKDKDSITISGQTEDAEETTSVNFIMSEEETTEEELERINSEMTKINGIITSLETSGTKTEEEIMQELISQGITDGALDPRTPTVFISKETSNKYLYEIIEVEGVHEVLYICKNNGWKIEEITYGESGIEKYVYVVELLGEVVEQKETTNGSYTFKNLYSNTEYTLYIKAIDYAGNEMSSSKIQVKTNVNPVTTGTVKFDYSTTNWTNEAISVYLSAHDAEDAELDIEYQIVGQGDRWILYAGEPITIGTNCIIRARFTDEDGAKGTITTGTVSNIDTQAPEIDVKTLTRMGMAWDNHFGFKGAYRIDEKYISISFKDADETKYTGSSGIDHYMLCNPDGSTFVDNRGICSNNLYDINNTYQKGGWYWFYMVKNNLGREKTVTSKHNWPGDGYYHDDVNSTGRYDAVFNSIFVYKLDNPDGDKVPNLMYEYPISKAAYDAQNGTTSTTAQYNSYLSNFYTRMGNYSWTDGNGFDTQGGYIQVVDKAGNISKVLIKEVPAVVAELNNSISW